jgi:hypothetical protein
MECPKCSYETSLKAMRCPQCAAVFDRRALEHYTHLVYMESKLQAWEALGKLHAVSAHNVSRLAAQEREALAWELGLRKAEVAAPPVQPSPTGAALGKMRTWVTTAVQSKAAERPLAKPHRPAPPAEPVPLMPPWITEQAPNLLLYLGAFLVVMAALVFVGASGEAISGAVRVAMLASFTVAFLVGGWLCYRFPRVRTAGYTFVAVGALLVPLNFAAAYNFVLDEQGIGGDVVWLWASVYSFLFYLFLAILGLGILYGLMSHAALISAVAATIAVSGLPPEWAPPVFVGLGIMILTSAWWVPARLRGTFRLPTFAATHFLVVASIIATFAIAAAVEDADPAAIPMTLAGATILFAVLTLTNTLNQRVTYSFLTHAGLTSALAAGLAISPMPVEWIPPVFAGLAISLLAVARWAPLPIREPFGQPGVVFAHFLAVASVGATFAIAAAVDGAVPAAIPITLAGATIVFAVLTLTGALNQRVTYSFLTHAGLTSALAAGLAVSPMPVEWIPPVFAGVAIALPLISRWAPLSIREPFGLPGLVFAHFLAVASVGATFAIAAAVDGAVPAAIPITLAGATIVFAVLTLTGALNQRVTYSFLTHAGLTSALAAGLAISPMPIEWIPPVFAGLAIGLLAFARWAPLPVREPFGSASLEFGRLLPVGAVVSACAITPTVADAERSALPVTLALTAMLFGFLGATDKDERLANGAYAPASLITAGGTLLSIVFVLDKPPEFYSVALVGIGGLYALAGALPVRLRLLRPETLWPFALGAATIAWLPFLEVHGREPWFGLAVAWGAGALYLAAAALMPQPRWVRAVYYAFFPRVSGESEGETAVEAWASPLLLFPFAATVALGYFRLLTATVGDLTAEELALHYLPLALGFAVAGMAARLWRRDWSLALYAVTLGFSIYVLGASYNDFGQMAVFMTVFAFAALVVALWEGEANVSYLAIAYGLFALVFALAHFEPADEVWPWPFVGLGALLYVIGLLLRRTAPGWGQPLRLSGLAVALFAPNVGFGLLSFRISEATDIGKTLPVAEPPVYLWSTGAVAFFGLLLTTEASRLRSLLLGYAGGVVLLTALLLGIGYLRLENPQPYVVPIGLFLLATARLLSSRRSLLSEDVRIAPEITEITAAIVLLGTTLIQTFGEHGTTYRFVLLGETIAYLLVGLLLRRRFMVVPALACAILSGALFAFEMRAEGAPPPWAILAIVGVALLGLGFLFLVRRDFWQRAQETAVNWWRTWET